jgi:hypothetical protein
MFLSKKKNAVQTAKNLKTEPAKTARKSDRVRELQLALLERVSGGICGARVNTCL